MRRKDFKRILIMALVLCLMFSVSACKKNKGKDSDRKPDSQITLETDNEESGSDAETPDSTLDDEEVDANDTSMEEYKDQISIGVETDDMSDTSETGSDQSDSNQTGSDTTDSVQTQPGTTEDNSGNSATSTGWIEADF